MRRLVASLKRRLMPPSETLDGYEQPELVDVIFRKTIAYEPQGDWPEIADASSVLDFGGGCGLHYKQAHLPDVRWAVVETPAMVERAKELASDRLHFFATVADAAEWLGDVDVMHSNGALQYAPDPAGVLRQLCGLRAQKMLWYRAALSDGETKQDTQSSLLGDNGPGSVSIREKTVRYERTWIPEAAFLKAHEGYTLTERGPDWFKFTR